MSFSLMLIFLKVIKTIWNEQQQTSCHVTFKFGINKQQKNHNTNTKTVLPFSAPAMA